MFIDIHVHTCVIPGPPRRGKQAYATPEQLIERYDAIGVESAVILPGVSPECAYVPQSNQEVLEVCKQYPRRFIPFCNIDPRSVGNALKRDPEYAVKFLEEFQERLFFGTDICAPDTTTPLVDFLLELRTGGNISESVFRKVARENAVRILDL